MRGKSAHLRARATLLGCLGLGGALVLLAPAAAGAQEVNPYGGGSTVVVSPRTDPGHHAAAPANTDQPSSTSLPFTGGDVAGLAAIGAGAVGIGVLATRARRRQTA
jgi:hypothetical protein